MNEDADRLSDSLIKSLEHLQSSNETIVLMPEMGSAGSVHSPSGPIRKGYALVWIGEREGYAREVSIEDAIDLIGHQWMAMRECDFARLLKLEIGSATLVARILSLQSDTTIQ